MHTHYTLRFVSMTLAVLALLTPSLGIADEGPTVNNANTAWMLTSTVLVLFMTIPGLSLFYAGLVRSKNVLSVLMQCFSITCMVSLLWLAYLYSLAFGDGGALQQWIGGLGKAFLSGVSVSSVSGDIPETVFSMFQLTFAIITPALIVGAFAERMKFSAMLWFSLLWVTVVYAPVCHWVWGGGWLQELGLMDFAGGTVVHINAGVAALVAALFMGRRLGFPETPMPPHNLTMTVAGASMLWVGWFGFNAGSALARMAPPAWPCWSRISARRPVRSHGCSLNGCVSASPVCWASSPGWWPGLGPSHPPPVLSGPSAPCVSVPLRVWPASGQPRCSSASCISMIRSTCSRCTV